MPFDIQFSEHGTLSHIVRGVQLVLALDAIDTVTVRFDFDSGPWRHFLSGTQQVHLRRLSRDIRAPHMLAQFRDADIKQVAFATANMITQDVPEQTWLLTTGGTVVAASDDIDRYLGHIEVRPARASNDAPRSPLCVPVGICTKTFGRRTVAGDGVLVVGCGDADADRAMLDMLAAHTGERLTLFDVYVQHVRRKPPAQVRLVEVQDPAGRAALYASCRYVVSGSMLQETDDHFVEEAAQLGCTVLCDFDSAAAPGTIWTQEAVVTSLLRAQDGTHTSVARAKACIPLDVQAARVAQMILEPARQPPWSVGRLHQYCEPQTVSPRHAHVAWVHCGRDAEWDEACVKWLSQSTYQAIYVDTGQTPLIFSCIFTALFSQQMARAGRPMPQVQGAEHRDSLRGLIAAYLRDNPNSQCDVVHLSCPLPEVLSMRHDLQALDVALAHGEMPIPPARHVGTDKMVFVNLPRPVNAGGVTAKVVGAADAIEQVLRGVMHEPSHHFAMVWLRRSGARTHHGRIYYHPFEQATLGHNEELALTQVRQHLQNGRIDALLAAALSSTVGLMQARAAWAQKDTPVVTLLHSLAAPRAKLDSDAHAMLYEGRSSDLYVAPSMAVLDAFRKRLAATSDSLFALTNKRFVLQGDVQVTPYGVDTSALAGMHKSTCRQLLHLPSERIVLLCVGRFNRGEACDLLPLLIALQHVVQAGYAPLLVLAGHDYDYGYSAEVREHIATLGLEHYVEVRKNIEAKQKSFLFGASDILLSVEDTIYHTFSMSVIEAMAAGMPVIASDWGSHKEIVAADETGILVPTYWTVLPAELDVQAALSEPPTFGHYRDLHESVAIDIEALCDAMVRLCNSSRLRRQMGQAGQRRACTHHAIRQQSKILSDAVCSRIDMARTDAAAGPSKRAVLPQDGVFAQFSGYPSAILNLDTVVDLTALSRDKTRLEAILSAADFGGDVELRNVYRLVEALGRGPASVLTLGEAAGGMRRVLRALKYGIVQVVQ